ncbi:class I mannose-6-phosphate isomerase [Sphingomonas flavalba]|uniref:class I mannose-6-phosphate isomerase n=1 Tax=Sphingomonas flavalba TaxID=2559804 RepID=UPI00109E1B40|nr:class I mannose-6-phosphate isomerase [Sphingomonas flavalba]
MPATRLAIRRVEKPWGRHHLWPGFADTLADSAPIGEIWFEAEHAREPALLVKYLFTSEKLSVQVHPDDAAAIAAGHPRGKDEAWVVLAAEPDATIALGVKSPVTREQLLAAARDGSIVDLLAWKPVAAGDVIYSPAGTIHAIGAGITLIEIQQNIDLTYRLYDYGRPRELHLAAGVAAACLTPFATPKPPRAVAPGRIILAEGGKFVLERWTAAQHMTLPAGKTGWFVPITGAGTIDGKTWQGGECWMAEGEVTVTMADEADMLFAYPGATMLYPPPAP